MKIKESKNLKYTKSPLYNFEEIEKVEPRKCILDSFHDLNEHIELHFKNGTIAFLGAINQKGGAELDLIETKLKDLIGKCYEEILNFNF